MGCGDEKLSKYLTQTFTAHCNAMICQQVTLLGDAEWPKVADAVIEALLAFRKRGVIWGECRWHTLGRGVCTITHMQDKPQGGGAMKTQPRHPHSIQGACRRDLLKAS